MTQKEIEKNSVCLVKGRFGKPDLNKVETEGQSYIIKDVRKRNFFFRWTLSWWLIQREWKIYAKLDGIKGVPRPLKRIDRFAFALELIPGKPIGRNENLPPSFFSNLRGILEEIHRRGVAHLDLRHKGNILVSDTGEPFLIDFNSSISLKVGGLLYRYFFPIFRWVDYGGFLKLKERVSPSSMTPEETLFLKRFNRLRKLWIFN
jgi:RIO-like serine/threonine protein kinase